MTSAAGYAASLGIAADGDRLVMRFTGGLEGRPGFLHGGAIAGLLEAAALAAGGEGARLVTITVDFLRAGRPVDTHASARIIRRGRRLVHVEARAWQDDPAQPIGLARISLVVGRGGG